MIGERKGRKGSAGTAFLSIFAGFREAIIFAACESSFAASLPFHAPRASDFRFFISLNKEAFR
jgi:hypothetical protein